MSSDSAVVDHKLTDRKIPGSTLDIERSSIQKDQQHTNGATDSAVSDTRHGLTRVQRIRHKLFWNDPQDEIDLQPHVDEPLVKKKELWGFFLFGFGYYTYNNTCQSLLLPILIQGVAMGASHLESDHSIPCPEDPSTVPDGDR
ncbi:hypothetical protein BGZ83_004837, partial [Gryganskiella cystojenkinii]